MWRRNKSRSTARSSVEIERFLDRWRLVATHRGLLWIQPAGPTLCPDELDRLVERLRSADDGTCYDRIILDLRHVRRFASPWTLIPAMIIRLSRSLRARCAVVGLRGQPAGVMALYRRNRELAELMSTAGRHDSR
ncbi:MAG: hypothetical protein V3T70_05310 [Phycisphaerae bacterium]